MHYGKNISCLHHDSDSLEGQANMHVVYRAVEDWKLNLTKVELCIKMFICIKRSSKIYISGFSCNQQEVLIPLKETWQIM